MEELYELFSEFVALRVRPLPASGKVSKAEKLRRMDASTLNYAGLPFPVKTDRVLS
jgi:hypothetical protein